MWKVDQEDPTQVVFKILKQQFQRKLSCARVIRYRENQIVGSKLSVWVRREAVHVSSALNLFPSQYSCDMIYVWYFCDYCICGIIYFNIFTYNLFLKSSICFPTLLLHSFPGSLCTDSRELHTKLDVIFSLLILFSAFNSVKYFFLFEKLSSASLNLSEPQLLPL